MKANDLRIGNLVLALTGETKYTEVVVNTIFGYGINSYYNEAEYVYDEIKPIPLTEEWLLKFGFTPNKYNDEFTLGDIMLDCEYTEKDTYNLSIGEYQSPIEIHYVHQLQNLYYALTNKELTIQ
jgi:hypothetical protein